MQQGLWGLTNGTEDPPDIKEEDKKKDENVKLIAYVALGSWNLLCFPVAERGNKVWAIG